MPARKQFIGINPSATIVAAGRPQSAGGGAAPIVLPTPPFDSTDLIGWWFDNRAGQGVDYIYTDTVGSNSISGGEDISGHGNGALRVDKTLQPLKGASGGPITDGAGKSLVVPRGAIVKGLTKVAFYCKVKPRSDLYAGGAKRTIFEATEGTTSAVATAATVAAGGSGYVVGDYITETGGTFSTAVILRVETVSAGAVLTATIIEAGAYTVVPSNPVAQGSTSNPPGTAAGSGATFNLTFTDIGTGSSVERFAVYLSSGTTGRRLYCVQSTADGTQSTTTIASGPQLTNDVFNSIGVELDLVAGTCDFYLNSTTTAYQHTGLTTGALGTADSVFVYIGDNQAVASPSYCELLGMVLRGGSLPDATNRATIMTSYHGLLS